MKLLLIAALILSSTPALAKKRPIPPSPTSALSFATASMGTGALVTTGFIGFVAAIVGYDIWRRLNCTDPLHLGGPGFDSPIRPGDNVMIPQCGNRQ